MGEQGAKILEAQYEAKLEFPGGGGGEGCKMKTLPGGSMDIFWNHTINTKVRIEFHTTKNAQRTKMDCLSTEKTVGTNTKLIEILVNS